MLWGATSRRSPPRRRVRRIGSAVDGCWSGSRCDRPRGADDHDVAGVDGMGWPPSIALANARICTRTPTTFSSKSGNPLHPIRRQHGTGQAPAGIDVIAHIWRPQNSSLHTVSRYPTTSSPAGITRRATTTRPGRCAMARAVLASSGSRLALITQHLLGRANRAAVARPIPELAPVTTTCIASGLSLGRVRSHPQNHGGVVTDLGTWPLPALWILRLQCPQSFERVFESPALHRLDQLPPAQRSEHYYDEPADAVGHHREPRDRGEFATEPTNAYSAARRVVVSNPEAADPVFLWHSQVLDESGSPARVASPFIVIADGTRAAAARSTAAVRASSMQRTRKALRAAPANHQGPDTRARHRPAARC